MNSKDRPEKRRIQMPDDSEAVESKRSKQSKQHEDAPEPSLPVHPENLSFHIIYELQKRGISQELFANKILGKSRKSFQLLLENVKPYRQMRQEKRIVFKKILEWLDLGYWDQIAVLNGYKIAGFEPLTYFRFEFKAGESAKSIRALELRNQDYSINLTNLDRRIKFELYERQISQEVFLRKVTGRPHPCIEGYEKILEFLNLAVEDQKTVLDGWKVRNFERLVEARELWMTPALEAILEEAYNVNPKPDPQEILWMAGKLRLTSFQVATWFCHKGTEDEPVIADKDKIDTRLVSQQIYSVIHNLHFTISNFCLIVLGSKNFRDMLRSPKPYEHLRTGKEIFDKIIEFLKLSRQDQMAVLRGQKIGNFEPIECERDRIRALPLTRESRILYDNLVQRIQFELKSRKIRYEDFAEEVLGMRMTTFCTLIHRRTRYEQEWRQTAMQKILDWVRQHEDEILDSEGDSEAVEAPVPSYQASYQQDAETSSSSQDPVGLDSEAPDHHSNPRFKPIEQFWHSFDPDDNFYQI